MVSKITETMGQDIGSELLDTLMPGEDGVLRYYEVLLEEVERTIAEHNEAAADALRCGDYDIVRQLMEWSEKAKSHRRRINDLQHEWAELFSMWKLEASIQSLPGPRVTLRLPDGLRTPIRAFRFPILASLDERGGIAINETILDDIYAGSQQFLKEDDKQPLLSDPAQPRWRNSSIWCLDEMAAEGLIAPGSARGTWEITDEGRTELARLHEHRSANGHAPSDEDPSNWLLGSDSDDVVREAESSFPLEAEDDEVKEAESSSSLDAEDDEPPEWQ